MDPWTPSDRELTLRAWLAIRLNSLIHQRRLSREEIKTARARPSEEG
jgi:predicted XRE-type DNA-binding protein